MGNVERRTHNCPPTLTDRQVLEFCKRGFLMLDGVVPDEINRRTFAYLDENPDREPSEILREDWFVDNVILNPQAAGAVRSLLGTNFALPILMSNHRSVGALPAQNWHRDGQSKHGAELNYLQVFYYPQAVTRDMGPTELLPGSHFLYSLSPFMGHYGSIRGAYASAAPAGSIFITVYSVWHRRSAGTKDGIRNLLKYNYWRTVPPARDWVVEPDFDLATADYGFRGSPTFRHQMQENVDAARMLFWLCGLTDEFRVLGGQGWPITTSDAKFLRPTYGFPLAPRSQ